MKTIKSITTKTVFGKPTKDDIGKTLMYVTGIVDASFVHNSTYGENVGLKGDFVAVNAQTGEKFASKAAFLPAQVTEQVIQQLEQGVIEIEFKTAIALMETDKNTAGYTYVAEAPQTEERKAKAAHLLEVAGDFPLAIENKSGKNKAA